LLEPSDTLCHLESCHHRSQALHLPRRPDGLKSPGHIRDVVSGSRTRWTHIPERYEGIVKTAAERRMSATPASIFEQACLLWGRHINTAELLQQRVDSVAARIWAGSAHPEQTLKALAKTLVTRCWRHYVSLNLTRLEGIH
jgi:hypothetical protein